MMTKQFWLKPFKPLSSVHSVDVVGRVLREKNQLTVSYEVLSDEKSAGCDNVLVPGILWQTIGLNCFISPVGNSQYWEFDFSPQEDWLSSFFTLDEDLSTWSFKVCPNQDWSVYQFEGYRKGKQAVPMVSTVSYSMLSTPRALHTSLKIDLDELLLSDQMLRIGVSAVTCLKDQQMIHWALAHPETTPDFHHPDSFALSV
ncbi:MAG: hypothetical protein AAFR18_14215 [Cyanobacteria bacterium J06627_32]